jgi:hypothetical protein
MGACNHFSSVGNANIQCTKPDFCITNMRLLQNVKELILVGLQLTQRHTNEIIVK